MWCEKLLKTNKMNPSVNSVLFYLKKIKLVLQWKFFFDFNNFRCVDENRYYNKILQDTTNEGATMYYGSMEIYIPLVVLLLIFIGLTILFGCKLRQMNNSTRQRITSTQHVESTSDERSSLHQKARSMNNEISPNTNIEMRVAGNRKDEIEARQSYNDPNNLE